MAYVITDLCTLCGACVEVCSVECIAEGDEQYYINPEKCIDCGSCYEECSSEAIFSEQDLPADKHGFLYENTNFFLKLLFLRHE
ncbi:MAG TPA: ferredoxin family protein [bacterium]|nr:ferredoxin family protein [bacterium]